MKLILLSRILSVTLICATLTSTAYAKSNIDAEMILANAKNNSMGEAVYEDENSMVDLRPISSKSTMKKKANNFFNIFGIAKEYTNTSTLKVSSQLFGSTAIAKSSSNTMEDYIYAKCRVYNSSGSLIDEKISAEEFSSLTSSTVNFSAPIFTSGDAYGNHIYKLSGYLDVIHETYDTW